MERLMRAYLLLISLIFSLSLAKAGNTHPFFPTNEGERREYTSTIQFNRNTLSGICIVKKEENKYIGTFINEFGIKAFDFIYDHKRKNVKILNTIEFLNKWYIKRVIRKDLKFLFTNKCNFKKKNREIAYSDSCIILTDNKYNIQYSFKPLIK